MNDWITENWAELIVMAIPFAIAVIVIVISLGWKFLRWILHRE